MSFTELWNKNGGGQEFSCARRWHMITKVARSKTYITIALWKIEILFSVYGSVLWMNELFWKNSATSDVTASHM